MAYPITNVTQYDGTITDYTTNIAESTAIPQDRIKDREHIIHNISIAVCIVTFILGTIGNGLVIFFASFRMKKTVNVVWFLNLAVADFIFTFLLIFRIVNLLLSYRWPFGRVMCKLDDAMFYINMFASLFLITVISVDRLLFVKFPVWCQNHRTSNVASIVTLIVWILALIFSLPYIIYKDINTNNVKGSDYCKYNKHVIMPIFMTRFIIGFVLPLAVIISCYTVIMLHIRRNYTAMSKKPLKTIAAVIIVFFVCWFPYHFFSLLRLFLGHRDKNHLQKVLWLGTQFSKSVAIMNSCINPLLYVFMGRDFKEKCWSSIQPIFERAFMEESLRASFKSKTNSIYTSKSSQIETTFTKVDMSPRVG